MPSREVEEMLAELAEAEAQQGTRPIGECVRILQCFECKSMDVLPDYPPQANPNDDAALHHVDQRHGGDTQQPHYRALHRIEKKVWEDRDAKKQFIDKMWSGVSGFTPSYYNVQDTLKDDAMKCWKDHRQPTADKPCLDYRSSSRIIKPPTRKDRKEMRRELEMAGQRNNIDLDRLEHDIPKLYVCSFCPYQVVVDHKKRVERGEG